MRLRFQFCCWVPVSRGGKLKLHPAYSSTFHWSLGCNFPLRPKLHPEGKEMQHVKVTRLRSFITLGELQIPLAP